MTAAHTPSADCRICRGVLVLIPYEPLHHTERHAVVACPACDSLDRWPSLKKKKPSRKGTTK